MKSEAVQMSIKLSQLTLSRRNPRKVKPSRESQQCLVALIRSQGLLQPLVVRPIEGKKYEVVAGERRLRALKEIHKNDGDPKIPCVVRDVDSETADAMSLGENFGRVPMHPIDEAEAFAKLATSDGKDAKAIAAEFGVPERYVRQRMKLATLAPIVKQAYREGRIDTATSEAFAAVPEDRQLEVWQQTNGNPRHAEHVRNVIAHAWIDAKDAIFNVSTLPASAVSQDLFGDQVLVERKVFMDAQAQALEAQRQALAEEGWKEVVVGRREDVQDRLLSMDHVEREFDKETSRELEKLAGRRVKLETAAEKLGAGDEPKLGKLQERFNELESQEHVIVSNAKEHFSEETKSLATAFLVLDPDGRVHRELRLPRRRQQQRGNGRSDASNGGASEEPKAPTSDELSDRQRSLTFTHQVLAVREALLGNTNARRRILAMILHEKIRSEALAVRHDANGATIAASQDGFESAVFKRLSERRAKLDPFAKAHFVEDVGGYEQLEKLSASKLDALIDLLVVECVTAHLLRPTKLVQVLAQELKINMRDHWKPDGEWLSSFQKIQLGHLVKELKGDLHAPPPERKKTELVNELAKLFADAADGKLEDKQLAQKVNAWLPSNLRPVQDRESEQKQRGK